MHTIYHTDAFVLDEAPIAEAGKLFTLFTRDLGLVRASAAGVRYEKSKLRFALSKYAKVHVALVQGKGGWRLTNAYADHNLYRELGSTPEFFMMTRVFSLMSRLIQGEEANTELFDTLNSSIAHVLEKQGTIESITDLECVIVLRILNNLGYIGDHKNVQFFTLDNAFGNEHITAMQENRAQVLKEINRALKQSHL